LSGGTAYGDMSCFQRFAQDFQHFSIKFGHLTFYFISINKLSKTLDTA
jgi:hypothetical protein